MCVNLQCIFRILESPLLPHQLIQNEFFFLNWQIENHGHYSIVEANVSYLKWWSISFNKVLSIYSISAYYRLKEKYFFANFSMKV